MRCSVVGDEAESFRLVVLLLRRQRLLRVGGGRRWWRRRLVVVGGGLIMALHCFTCAVHDGSLDVALCSTFPDPRKRPSVRPQRFSCVAVSGAKQCT